MELGNLPEKEFRIIIVKMIQDLGKMEKMQETEERKNKEIEMNNTVERINSRIMRQNR